MTTLAEAQKGTLRVTYLRFRSLTQPAARLELPAEFWKDAEIVDYRGWIAGPGLGSCVARRVGDPNAAPFSELLINSAVAKKLWRALPKGTTLAKGEIPDGEHVEKMLVARDHHKSGEAAIEHTIDLDRVAGHSLQAKQKRLVKKASAEQRRRNERI